MLFLNEGVLFILVCGVLLWIVIAIFMDVRSIYNDNLTRIDITHKLIYV